MEDILWLERNRSPREIYTHMNYQQFLYPDASIIEFLFASVSVTPLSAILSVCESHSLIMLLCLM